MTFNRILFGIIGILFIGVVLSGVAAFSGTGIAPVSDDDAQQGAVVTATTTTPSSDAAATSSASAQAPQGAPAQAPGTYTLAQVAQHNSKASCYTAISGSVYDVTPFISRHPGGANAILSLCGTDGTAAFTNQHDGQKRPASELATFKIGTLIP